MLLCCISIKGHREAACFWQNVPKYPEGTRKTCICIQKGHHLTRQSNLEPSTCQTPVLITSSCHLSRNGTSKHFCVIVFLFASWFPWRRAPCAQVCVGFQLVFNSPARGFCLSLITRSCSSFWLVSLPIPLCIFVSVWGLGIVIVCYWTLFCLFKVLYYSSCTSWFRVLNRDYPLCKEVGMCSVTFPMCPINDLLIGQNNHVRFFCF